MRDKKPFEFSYTMPSLDWYEIINVKINLEDYYYFTLERRFGPSWWLIGKNPVDKPSYHWEEKELGELGYENRNEDVKRFIEWAKTDYGSKITEIRAISGNLDVLKSINKLLKEQENVKNS